MPITYKATYIRYLGGIILCIVMQLAMNRKKMSDGPGYSKKHLLKFDM